MSEAEKQESQKTVVAFITGLLIGGLLVWVFSATPEGKKEAVTESTDKEQVEKTNTEKTAEVAEVKAEKTAEVTGKGSLTVRDQKAGDVVAVEKAEFPTKSGWVVVRDYMDGAPGNVLGAARYSADEGLVPTAVELIRVTTAGSSYLVMFYTNEGQAGFSSAEDKPIEGASATFKAN
jgi:hypothetical protein